MFQELFIMQAVVAVTHRQHLVLADMVVVVVVEIMELLLLELMEWLIQEVAVAVDLMPALVEAVQAVQASL
jgi:hypothetical protein